MDAVIAWIIANPTVAAVILDAVLGAIPDKWIPYVGGVREIFRAISKVLEK